MINSVLFLLRYFCFLRSFILIHTYAYRCWTPTGFQLQSGDPRQEGRRECEY